jgi:multisubunit Na+/H+ antiporter MnhB subunit
MCVGGLMSIAVASTAVRSARHTVVAYIIFIIYCLLFSIFFLLIAAPDILEGGLRRK